MEIDKENANARLAAKRNPTKSSSGFGRLLKDATNQIRVEDDSKLAEKIQIDIACDVVADWIREDSDLAVAKQLQEEAEKQDAEEAQRRKKILEQDEAAAMKVAIEERKGLKSRAEEKASIAKKDALLAEKLRREDEELYRQQLEADAKFAQQLNEADEKEIHSQRSATAGPSDCKSINPTILMREDSDNKELKYLDEKDMDEKSSSPAALKDMMIYAESESKSTSHRGEEKASSNNSNHSNHRCRKPSLGEMREDIHMLSRAEYIKFKSQQVLSKSDAFPTEQLLANQWEEAVVEIEDVRDGMCISIVLPNLRTLNVNSLSNGQKIWIEAERMINSAGFANSSAGVRVTEANSQYNAEFKLNGKNICITDSDIKYEYSSETGLLFIFVAKVYLDDSTCDKNHSSSPPKPTNTKQQQSAIGARGGIVGSIKNGFARVFGKK